MGRAGYRVLGAAAVIATFGLLVVGSAFAASITSFTPIQGSVDANGTIVTLTGSGFTNAKNVFFNGIPAPWWQVGSDTQIFARIPTNATTGYITVTASDGSTVSTQGLTTVVGAANGTFTVLPSFNAPGTNAGLTPTTSASGSTTGGSPAKVASFSPTSGKPGTKVTLTGSNFKGANHVRFGGVGASKFTVSGSHIVVLVPLHAKSGHITVSNAAGTGSSSGTFTVTK
jgi:IPT/TIG domain